VQLFSGNAAIGLIKTRSTATVNIITAMDIRPFVPRMKIHWLACNIKIFRCAMQENYKEERNVK
jgi:hypothetical protein